MLPEGDEAAMTFGAEGFMGKLTKAMNKARPAMIVLKGGHNRMQRQPVEVAASASVKLFSERTNPFCTNENLR